MTVRIGISLGPAAVPGGFAAAVDDLERVGIDSLWLSETVYGPLVEPFTGMTFALARTSRLKVGTGLTVLPGRHPVLVAKQLVTLAGLAPGRVLPVFGLRPARPAEMKLFPAPPRRRAALFDESLHLLRMLLRQNKVNYSGEFYTVEDANVGPRPSTPIDIWLGGVAPGGLARVGRFGDGWMGSFMTPAEAGRARVAIEEVAASAGRKIEPDHFGVSLAVATDGVPPGLIAALRQRRPKTDPASLVASGWDDARRMVEEFAEAGMSKFVIRPAAAKPAMGSFIGQFVTEMLPLQT